ncbi:MAG TPA: amylo-alpha-1,6-glucosidase, partial [Patescibacteria group bacterium]|nr:amylo-alpha-1,6-glucosidase [Patescibacteria group bacterium]
MESEHVTKQLRLLATDSLRACYVQEGVVASPTHFSDFWARDTFWALPGMLAVGDHRVAKKSIELFLFYQREDGKIPRKISRDINILKYLFGATFKRKHQRPVYTALVRPFYSMDDNALLVRAVWKYFEKTGDKQSLEKWYPQLLAAIQWYRPRVKELLVHEGILANWKDTVFTPGACLYTNVIYCEALRCFSEISGVVGEDGQQKRFARKHAVVEMRMQKIFWNGTFLEEKQSFDVAGNMLACWFDLVDEKKQRSIMVEFHKRSKKNIFFATQYPLHPWWRINPIALVLGMGDYHNG